MECFIMERGGSRCAQRLMGAQSGGAGHCARAALWTARTKTRGENERGGWGGVWKRRSGLMCHLQAKWQTGLLSAANIKPSGWLPGWMAGLLAHSLTGSISDSLVDSGYYDWSPTLKTDLLFVCVPPPIPQHQLIIYHPWWNRVLLVSIMRLLVAKIKTVKGFYV